MRGLVKLWLQIRGNAKWDTLSAACKALMGGGLLTGAWSSVRWWLIQPVQSSTLVSVWLICALLFWVLLMMNGKLTLLDPSVEFVSQRPEGTGYKRPGSDMAIVLPFKNRSSWWHSGLSQLQVITAHIDFFTEEGKLIESCYGGMWLNECSSEIVIPPGQTRYLIVAVKEHTKHGYFVPEAGTKGVQVADILEAFRTGQMLSLKCLSEGAAVTLIANIRLDGSGYSWTGQYKLFLRSQSPGMEFLKNALRR